VLRAEWKAFVARWKSEHEARYPDAPFRQQDDTWAAADVLLYYDLTPDDVKDTSLWVPAAHWKRVLANKDRVARWKGRATPEQREAMLGWLATSPG
jgi:hypothetical protein